MNRGRGAPAGWNGTSRRRPRLGWLVLAVVAGLAVGVLAGLGLPGPSSPAPPVAIIRPSPASPDSGGIGLPTVRWEDGVPAGWPPTRSGAVAAAAGYARVLSALWFLTDAARRGRAVVRMAAPEALGALQVSQDAIAKGIASGPLGAGLGRRGVATLLRTSLLGYRLQSYSPTQAQVALWAVVLYGNDGGLAPQALYATSTLRLRWVGDWKLVQVTTVPGPVPVQGQPTPTAAAELIHADQTFKEFDDAPHG